MAPQENSFALPLVNSAQLDLYINCQPSFALLSQVSINPSTVSQRPIHQTSCFRNYKSLYYVCMADLDDGHILGQHYYFNILQRASYTAYMHHHAMYIFNQLELFLLHIYR